MKRKKLGKQFMTVKATKAPQFNQLYKAWLKEGKEGLRKGLQPAPGRGIRPQRATDSRLYETND